MTAELVELEPAPPSTAPAESPPAESPPAVDDRSDERSLTRADRLGLLAVVALSAVARLPGIAARGRFDADQGHDMLVLLGMTQGTLPLLGPGTSVGEFHHGAFYYYLLSPAALVSGADPVVVTVWLALLGIGAVALTWWLARSIGGPLAGLVAGLLLAVSPAGIEQSTFIWNPNPIPFFAALSLAGAWQGHLTGRSAWWALALGAAAAVVQLHVLGAVFLVGIVGLMLFEARWVGAGTPARRALRRGALWGAALAVLLSLPLIVHELQTGFLETRRILAYLLAGDGGDGAGPLGSLFFTLLRVVGWPLVGLVTDAPALAAAVLAGVVGLVGWLVVVTRGPRATAVRWLTALLAWTVVALAFAAPSLQRVVAGLPNDHYHAFADPIVCILVALGAVTLLERSAAAATGAAATRAQVTARVAARVAVGVGLGLLVAVEILRWPPAADPDGGWPAARDAGARIAAAAGGGSVILMGLPDFKLPDGIGFPVVHAGAELVAVDAPADVVVVACDRLFEAVISVPCGGFAEDLLVQDLIVPPGAEFPFSISRFEASPRTSISIYTPR